MAITFITGVPKSGKTYFSVFTIWIMYKFSLFKYNVLKQWFWFFFPPERKEVYTTTYTNIKGFNFDYNPQIKPLVWKELYRNLERLHSYYLSEKSEDYLVSKSKEFGLYNALFIIDECQNHFNKKEDDVLVWWLTYHAHLHHEIHLITKHMKLIADKYKGIAEYFYKVTPSSKSNFKSMFTIGFYSSGDYYKTTFVKAIHIPVKKEIFEMYTAGKPEKRAQQLKNILLVIPVLVIILVGMSINFLTSLGGDAPENDNTTDTKTNASTESNQTSQTITQAEQVINTIKEQSLTPIKFKIDKLLTFHCVNLTCSYKNIKLPLTFLLHYIKNHQHDYHDLLQITPIYTQYTFLSTKEFEAFLLEHTENKEKKTKKERGEKTNAVPSLNIFGN